MTDVEIAEANSGSDGSANPINVHPQNLQHATWTRAYWVVLLNQIMVIGFLTLVGRKMAQDSYQIGLQASEVYNWSYDWPKLSAMYLADGPVELANAGFVSVAVSLAAFGLRRRFAGTCVASFSFVVCIMYLSIGMLASNLLFQKALKNILMLEE